LPRFIGGFILRKASWIFGVDIDEILEMMRVYKKDHVMRGYIVNRLVEAISIKKPF
jgi:hypothetical protein